MRAYEYLFGRQPLLAEYNDPFLPAKYKAGRGFAGSSDPPSCPLTSTQRSLPSPGRRGTLPPRALRCPPPLLPPRLLTYEDTMTPNEKEALRDTLATAAMAAIISTWESMAAWSKHGAHPHLDAPEAAALVAQHAYQVADAMLIAREGGAPPALNLPSLTDNS